MAAEDWGGRGLADVLAASPCRGNRSFARGANTDIEAARSAFADDRPLTGTQAVSASGHSAYTFVRDPNDPWASESGGEGADDDDDDFDGTTEGKSGGGDDEQQRAVDWSALWGSLCEVAAGRALGAGAARSSRCCPPSAAALAGLDLDASARGGLTVAHCRRVRILDATSTAALVRRDGASSSGLSMSAAGAGEEAAECSICVEALAVAAAPGQTALERCGVELPCLHRFHAKCLAPWLRRKATCPLCRLDLSGPLG